MSEPQSDWQQVQQFAALDEAYEYALVLTALGIECWLLQESSGEEPAYALLVRPAGADVALRQLAEYTAERSVWPPAASQDTGMRADLRDVLGFWLVLITGFVCQQHRALGADWLVAGRAHAGDIVQGEWWRTITALTLHADGPHLFGNLLFGTLFGFLLSHELGRGVGWLGVLLAGAAGNGLNAVIRSSDHASVGASTAVFAAIGMTMVLQWRYHADRGLLLQRWTPPIIGMVFLGFLGTAGERTDVPAHIWGLLTGLGAGALLHRVRSRLPAADAPQGWLEAVSLLILCSAWLLALQHAGR